MGPVHETRDIRAFAVETKFVIDAGLAERIRVWARPETIADPHGSGPFGDAYTTTTLYFDTDGFDVFHRRGSNGRGKYRIRRYGTSDVAFLERKLRTSTLLTKRRTMVNLEDMARAEAAPWFHDRLAARKLKPVCLVAYRRTARLFPTPYGLARLTLDHGLVAQAEHGWRLTGTPETAVLDGQVILEIKHRVAMPAFFKRLVEEFKLEPQAVSKYRTSAAKLGLDPTSTDAPCLAS